MRRQGVNDGCADAKISVHSSVPYTSKLIMLNNLDILFFFIFDEKEQCEEQFEKNLGSESDANKVDSGFLNTGK